MGVCGKIQPQPAAPSPRATRKRATARRRDVRRRGPVRSMCQRFLSKVFSEVLPEAPPGGPPGVPLGVPPGNAPGVAARAAWRSRCVTAALPSRPLHRRTRSARSDFGQVRRAAAFAAETRWAAAPEPIPQRRPATARCPAFVGASRGRSACGSALADGRDGCVRRARRGRGRSRGNTGRLRNRPAAGGDGPGATDGCTNSTATRRRRARSLESGARCPGEAPGRTTWRPV